MGLDGLRMILRILAHPRWRPKPFAFRLTGGVDIDLTWTPETLGRGATPPPGAPPLPTIHPNGPSIFTALQEQLGLELEAERGPVEVRVIDRVERPTPD
jgi:uncharacterized protein (TIGR03435 family)